MSVYVFSGPTLAPEAAKVIFPEARCLGPAARGDILRVVRSAPVALCLIDGYFEHVPAVSHKEILFALTRGAAVYGAASIGALRAAELVSYGMIGHGRIYEAYASGLLEDDSEVAVTHADETRGYAGSSEALVNLRATLQVAVERGVAPMSVAQRLLAAAAETFYADRTRQFYSALAGELQPEADAARLRAWLGERANWVDQKRLDCVSLLQHVRGAYLEGRLEASADQCFAPTSFWLSQVDDVRQADLLRDASDVALVHDEVQRAGRAAVNALEFAATRRALCKALVRFAGSADPEADLDAAMASASRAARAELPEIIRLLPEYPQLLTRAKERTEEGTKAKPTST